MNSTNLRDVSFFNSSFIFDIQNFDLSKTEEDVRIDDFSYIFDSIEFKIIWFLCWIVFESFTNVFHYFIIMFEKFEGFMTFSCRVKRRKNKITEKYVCVSE